MFYFWLAPKCNKQFEEYLDKTNLLNQASLNAHCSALKILQSLPTSHEVTKESKKLKKKNNKTKIEFEINEDLVKFYEKSFKFKKEKS